MSKQSVDSVQINKNKTNTNKSREKVLEKKKDENKIESMRIIRVER